MIQFDLLSEPRGAVLDGLIAAAVDVCDRFTIERSGMILDDRAVGVLRQFEPFLIACEEVSETPGSILPPPNTTTLCTYRLNPDSGAIIGRSARGLYAWVEPELPQCLCFLRGTEPWLINLAADDAGYLILTQEEAATLRQKVPGLSLREVPARDIHRH